MRNVPLRVPGPLLALGAILLITPDPAAAQECCPEGGNASAAGATRSAPSLEPAARSGEVRVDGRLDEPAWRSAPVASGFVQSEPVEGAPASQDTKVRVLIDDEAIYVSARMWDEEPETIGRQLVRRDQRGRYFDWFGVSLDPDRDRRTGYAFRVNAAGVQQDLYVYDDSFQDISWNAVWESAVRIDSLGWTAELRIPLSQIRYDSGDGPQTWGVNFYRRRVASAELTHFALESRLREGIVSQYGTLENVRVPSSVRRIEVRPYVLSSFHSGPADEGDPFFDGTAAAARLGADFRFGLGSAFTLDATVNPDFGQVEADPAVINLSAFETFFDEQRPFFVEDAQIFDFSLSGGRNQLFYSRRIGRSPHGEAPEDAAFAEVPDAATILGATKITGRTTSGLSVGALAAVTQAESGRAYFPDGRFAEFRVEPRTEYGVVRVQQDFNGGASQFGGIITALNRALPASGEFDDLPDQAYSAGLRFEHQWDDRNWRLHGFLAGSHIRGTPEAMVAIQTASNHYFQRPDATRFELDPTRNSLTGAEWRLQLDRQNGEHWTGAVWLAEVTEGFEINDLGFSGTMERLDGGTRINYREIQPGRIFRDYSFGFMNFNNVSHEALDDAGSWDSWRKAYTAGTFSLDARFTLLNYWGGNANLSYRPDTYSRTATRGGPIMLEPGHLNLRMGFNTDQFQEISFDGGINYRNGNRPGSHSFSIDGSANLRPVPQLQVDFRPRFEVRRDGSQYVASTSAMPYQPTFGTRYFYGELEQKTLSMETRVNWVFSPTLSFQLFAQPLVSSGDFVAYKQLARASSYEFVRFEEGRADPGGGEVACVGGRICQDPNGDQHVDLDADGTADFSFDDQDFNVRSLIGNAVLRWEYRPGSTVFLVWQRRQARSADLGDFEFGRDLHALWDAPADNRFLVKVNYWLGL